MHSRRFHAEPERLVVVGIASIKQRAVGHLVIFSCFVFDLATHVVGSRVTAIREESGEVDVAVAAGQRLRAFAGQVDPIDASHFTIDYDIDGDRSTIHGWLQHGGRSLLVDRGKG